MSGLGIDFDPPLDASVSKDTENVVPKGITLKSSRRRAHVRGRSHHGKGDSTNKAHAHLQIPSMPLRENQSIANAGLQTSPVYTMKHPLPAKPIVDWSVMQDVQPVPARLRVETPSDTSTSPQSLHVTNPAPINMAVPMAQVPIPTPSSTPYLHTTPMLPPERDERVNIDIFLENDLCVERSTLHGYISNDGPSEPYAGEHVLPFSLQVPMDKGAKGSYQSNSAEVGYIIIASVRVKAFGEKQGGVAHCFQKLQLYPYLNPTSALASASQPIVARSNSAEANARGIQLAASLHRETWVAGQRVYFDVSVLNNGENMLNMLRIALVRVENLYHMRSVIPASPLDLNSSSSIIVDETLTAGNTHHWWTGAPSGIPVYFAHSFQLPDNIISIERSRHVEVQYMLRIGVGADASTLVEVDLPLQVINYVSLDPPPPRRTYMNAVGLLRHSGDSLLDQHQMIERLRALDAMRSPKEKQNSSMLSPEMVQPVAIRTTQHKRSLDFINSAIRSATARHTSPFATSAVRGPVDSVADTSLALGDETVGDVELAFDKDQSKADNSNYGSFYSDSRSDLSD
ncbi:unnamed protein product [Malassezia sympodialis ATCC 42132]|uniref:uncharacterized protein n=1 Tax=Malassezia sympodialis (strain ATCC 42132) TaxID=1230383 RepID=UPI0002C29EBD|nr:uncharacterized protein MSY001_1945 [Malassezia sympodialis ATCC 42132]CCU99239.1 unnamed protein product [Malassezia sympodialis ATCC 42132]|eukprot:XP_018740500.1 uncharacterized protein MSY001_1945 [Malassezia sympodialis ATCC 42132]